MTDRFNMPVSLPLFGNDDLRCSSAGDLRVIETGEGLPLFGNEDRRCSGAADLLLATGELDCLTPSLSSPLALFVLDEELTDSPRCRRLLLAPSFSRTCITMRGFCARLPPIELPRSGTVGSVATMAAANAGPGIQDGTQKNMKNGTRCAATDGTNEK